MYGYPRRRYDAYASGARAGYRRGKRAVYRSRGYKKLKAGYAPGRRRHRGWGVQYHQPSAQTATQFGRSWREADAAQKANRQQNHYYGRGRYYSGRGRYYSGRGGYFSNWGRMARNTGRMIGRQARRAANTLEAAAPAAALIPGIGPELALGMAAAGEGLDEVAHVGRHIRGSGQYTAPLVNSSESIELGQRFGHPHFSTGAVNDADDGGLCISNQEFVSNIYANDNGVKFTSQVFTVNPGLAQTFPMLSQFAVNFERYEMIQCVFHFETALDSGVLQSETGQVGDVLMYSHVDPTEPPFESVADFMSNGGSLTQVTKGLACGVECDPDQLSGLPNAGLNMVRTMPQTDDKQAEADQATLQIAVSDTNPQMAGHVIGKLYVSYTVKLIKPRLVSLQGGNILFDQFIAHGHRTVTQDKKQYILPSVTDEHPARLPHSNIGGSLKTIAFETQTIDDVLTLGRQCIRYTLPPWLNGVFKIRLRLMSADPPDENAEEWQTANTWPDSLFGDGNVIQQLVNHVETDGNVKVLPHSLRIQPHTLTGTAVGYQSAVNYEPNSNVDNAQDGVQALSLDGTVDNSIIWNPHDKASGGRQLHWVGYFECTFRCSPATASEDNDICLYLTSHLPNSNWPAPVGTQTGESIPCFMMVNVESTNGFDINSSMKLATHMQSLVSRNTDAMEYNAEEP